MKTTATVTVTGEQLVELFVTAYQGGLFTTDEIIKSEGREVYQTEEIRSMLNDGMAAGEMMKIFVKTGMLPPAIKTFMEEVDREAKKAQQN